MITLYGMTSPNVVKVIIALEELGLPNELKTIDVFSGQQFDAAFVKLNPNAKVPVIVDSDGPGGKPYTVFESGASPRRPASSCRRSARRATTSCNG